MNDYERSYPMQGYILLPHEDVNGYSGIDRNPFVLSYPLELPGGNLPVSPIWRLHSSTWEQNAYRLLEENLIHDPQYSLDLINSIEVARAIKNIIELYLSPFDIIHCKVWNIDNPEINTVPPSNNDFLGYDIAYGGGDYFSAIKSGLFTIEDSFTQKYKSCLNRSGLFADTSKIHIYLSDFRAAVLSEANAIFDVFELTLMPDK